MGKRYKFKNNKHSVIMVLISHDNNGNCVLEHETYKGLIYKARLEELEEVK